MLRKTILLLSTFLFLSGLLFANPSDDEIRTVFEEYKQVIQLLMMENDAGTRPAAVSVLNLDFENEKFDVSFEKLQDETLKGLSMKYGVFPSFVDDSKEDQFRYSFRSISGSMRFEESPSGTGRLIVDMRFEECPIESMYFMIDESGTYEAMIDGENNEFFLQLVEWS